MTLKMPTSPYLDKPNRLGEVIAALQVMGSYPTAADETNESGLIVCRLVAEMNPQAERTS